MKQTQKIFIGVLILLALSSSMAWAEAWITKRITKNPGTSYSSSIAVVDANVYVVWVDDTTGRDQIHFKKSMNGGSTWLPEQRLTDSPNYVFDPDIAASGSNIYVAWTDGMGEDYSEIYLRRSKDGGATWLPAQRLTNLALDSQDVKIAASGLYVYVAWGYVECPSPNSEIYFMRSLDGGATWKAIKRLTKDAWDTGVLSIASSGSNVYLVWAQDDMSKLCFRRSKNSGALWQVPKELERTGPWSLSIAASESNVYVVWSTEGWGYYYIYFSGSKDAGTTWLPIKKCLANDQSYRGGTSLAAEGSNVYLAWTDEKPGNPEIFFRKSKDGGMTWKAPQRLTNNTKRDLSPHIAVSDTKIYVTWSEEIGEMYGSEWDIYLKWAKVLK